MSAPASQPDRAEAKPRRHRDRTRRIDLNKVPSAMEQLAES